MDLVNVRKPMHEFKNNTIRAIVKEIYVSILLWSHQDNREILEAVRIIMK